MALIGGWYSHAGAGRSDVDCGTRSGRLEYVSMFANRLTRVLLFTCAVAVTAGAAESYTERAKRSDMKDPAALMELVRWCEQNGQPTRIRPLLLEVVRRDKDNAEARAALGQMKIDGRWVAKPKEATAAVQPPVTLPTGTPRPTVPVGAKPSGNTPTSAGPTAAQVPWATAVPTDPQPHNPFLDQYLEDMNKSGNDSSRMDVAISTCLLEENLPMALPRLCTALSGTTFNDLYGPSLVIQGLLTGGRREDARLLLGFLARASVRSSDGEDLATFCATAGTVHDKRAIPRLIELMHATDAEVAQAATDAAAAITGLAKAGLTPAAVAAWWGRFHAMDDRQILQAQATAKDPDTALTAATALAVIGDKQAIDVFITWMASDDVRQMTRAHEQLGRFLGSDWAFVPTDPPEVRAKRLAALSAWWKDNRGSFTLLVDERLRRSSAIQPTAAPATDEPLVLAVSQIGSANPKAAIRAESLLTSAGQAAIRPLIGGLSSPDPITARKCNELLIRLAGKNDIAFDPRAPTEQRQAAIAAWQTWASTQQTGGQPATEQPATDAP